MHIRALPCDAMDVKHIPNSTHIWRKWKRLYKKRASKDRRSKDRKAIAER